MAPDPMDQDEAATLEAELRQALQHRKAAQERAEETARELQRLMDRAKEIMARRRAILDNPRDPEPPTPS